MSETNDTTTSPIGGTVEATQEAALLEAEYRAEHDRLAPFEALARLVIMRRASLGISQAELARRMKTTPSVISRIESGQHATNARTLQRLANALEARAVLGFEFGPDDARQRTLAVI